MKKDIANQNFDYNIVPYVWGYAFVVSIIIYFTYGAMYMNSFIVGVATNLLSFTILKKGFTKAATMQKEKIMLYIIKNQMYRTFLYFAVLTAVFFNDNLDVVVAFIGITSVKIVTYIYMFFKREVNE